MAAKCNTWQFTYNAIFHSEISASQLRCGCMFYPALKVKHAIFHRVLQIEMVHYKIDANSFHMKLNFRSIMQLPIFQIPFYPIELKQLHGFCSHANNNTILGACRSVQDDVRSLSLCTSCTQAFIVPHHVYMDCWLHFTAATIIITALSLCTSLLW